MNVADVAEITYDNVTLDFDAVGDVNSDWAFGGASASYRRPMTVWAYYRSRIL